MNGAAPDSGRRASFERARCEYDHAFAGHHARRAEVSADASQEGRERRHAHQRLRYERDGVLGDAEQGEIFDRLGRIRVGEYAGGESHGPVGNEAGRPIGGEAGRKKALARRSGWPLDRFSVVERAWSGGTVCILGGGPSLTGEQCAAVEAARKAAQVRVIAVNDAYLIAPWADICYFADASWHAWQVEGRPKPKLGLTSADVRARFAAFAGQKCSIQNTGGSIDDAAVHLLRNLHYPQNGTGLSLDPEYLVTGSNSGFQALNLAVLAGARTIVLLGFDARDADGEEHWHGRHQVRTVAGAQAGYRRSFASAAKAIKAAGVTVLNCSPGSAITCFERADLMDALPQ